MEGKAPPPPHFSTKTLTSTQMKIPPPSPALPLKNSLLSQIL